MTTRDRLLVFARYPEPGRVKTRLVPTLGPDGAARLHREMAAHTLAAADDFAAAHADVDVEVWFAGGNISAMAELFGAGRRYRPQADGDLGARLWHATREAFDGGARNVLVIGTDCPGLTAEVLAAARKALATSDVVLGPALDGGYYLLGSNRPVEFLFERIPWGTSAVLQATLAAAERLDLAVTLLVPLPDVDRPEDLSVWEERCRPA